MRRLAAGGTSPATGAETRRYGALRRAWNRSNPSVYVPRVCAQPAVVSSGSEGAEDRVVEEVGIGALVGGGRQGKQVFDEPG